MTGVEIFEKLAKARIHLAINFARKTRGFLAALCVSPCRASDLLDGDAVIVNKKSDDDLAKHFEEGKKIFEEL